VGAVKGSLIFVTTSRLVLGSTHRPIQRAPAVKRPGHKVHHSPPSPAEFKNMWSYTSIPLCVVTVWCLVNTEDFHVHVMSRILESGIRRRECHYEPWCIAHLPGHLFGFWIRLNVFATAIPPQRVPISDWVTNPMKQSPCEADSHLANKEIPRLCGTRRFITVFTTARHWSLFRARCI